MTIKLDPANPGEVAVYQPYYSQGRRPLLPLAVGLYKRGSLEGERLIEGEAAVGFVVSWAQSALPSDLTICQVQFAQEKDFQYEMSIPNYEFVDYLIDVVTQIQRDQPPDFSTAFYRKLMRRED